jgi:hypothetical protein
VHVSVCVSGLRRMLLIVCRSRVIETNSTVEFVLINRTTVGRSIATTAAGVARSAVTVA